MIELWAMVGVIFAACSVVGNDAVQTLGTFIASNKKISWLKQWVFSNLF